MKRYTIYCAAFNVSMHIVCSSDCGIIQLFNVKRICPFLFSSVLFLSATFPIEFTCTRRSSRFMHMDSVMQTATLAPLNKNIPNMIFRRLCDKTGLKIQNSKDFHAYKNNYSKQYFKQRLFEI